MMPTRCWHLASLLWDLSEMPLLSQTLPGGVTTGHGRKGNCFISLFVVYFLLLFAHMCTMGAGVQHSCRGLRTTLWSWFFPFTFM